MLRESIPATESALPPEYHVRLRSRLHLLAQGGNVSGRLDDALSSVVVLVQLVPEALKHGRIGIADRGLGLLRLAAPVALNAQHGFFFFFFVSTKNNRG